MRRSEIKTLPLAVHDLLKYTSTQEIFTLSYLLNFERNVSLVASLVMNAEGSHIQLHIRM